MKPVTFKANNGGKGAHITIAHKRGTDNAAVLVRYLGGRKTDRTVAWLTLPMVRRARAALERAEAELAKLEVRRANHRMSKAQIKRARSRKLDVAA